jgi:hypothetical protein
VLVGNARAWRARHEVPVSASDKGRVELGAQTGVLERSLRNRHRHASHVWHRSRAPAPSEHEREHSSRRIAAKLPTTAADQSNRPKRIMDDRGLK